MKIVYCIDRIDALGGTERITVVKANALARIPGNEVYIVEAYQRHASVNLLEKAELISLDIRYDEDIGLNPVKAFLFLRKKRREHRKKLEYPC